MGDKAGVDAHHGAAEPDKGRGGVLSKVFNGGRQRKKSQEAIQSTVTTQIRRSSKVEHVHNPDFFEADENTLSLEITPRTRNLSVDDDDGKGAEEEGQAAEWPALPPTPEGRRRSRASTARSPRQQDSGDMGISTSNRHSLGLVLSAEFLHNLTSLSTTTALAAEEPEPEEILSVSNLPPPPPQSTRPPSPSAEDGRTAPLSPRRSPPNSVPPGVAANSKGTGVSFFGLSSPRAFVEPATASPPSADAAGGPYPPQPSAPTGAPPSAPAPAPLVKEEITTTSNPTPPGPRDTGALTLGHTAVINSNMAETDRRVSMRLMAPLMRRYSQEIKTGAFGLTTTRIKEKKQVEAAVNRFNQKPSAGIDMLVAAGVIKRTPEDVAAFIRQKGSELSKKRVGELVGGLDPFNQEVLRLLLQEYDFTGMSLDQAMRVLIMDIRFPGESQMIDRIIERFSHRYYECNPAAFATQDAVHILSFSLIMLNTDLHNRNLNPRKKMKLEDFIKNNRGINNGTDLPRELLEELYNEIKSHELRMKEGDMYESDILTFMAPRLSGWLWKKSEGTFAQWKRHWFVLTGGCVYYFEAPQRSTPRCIIPLDSVTAAKGGSSTEIILYSNFGTVIKSVKIIEGRMVQGDHHRYVLRASDITERDEWVEALQRETVVPLVELDRLKATASSTSSHRSPRRSTSNLSGATTTTTGKSPRPSRNSGNAMMVYDNLYRCIAEGWMRRRSDVSRSWQRRYFMLIVMEKKKDRRVMLSYFTTQEMGQRMVDMGVSTEQGSIPMGEVTAFRVKTPADVINYRPPDAKATVFEVEYDRFRELVSPEDDVSLQYWLDALRPVIHSAYA